MLWTSNNYHDFILFRYRITRVKVPLFKYIRKVKKYKLKEKLKKSIRYKKKLIKKPLYQNNYSTIINLRLKQKKKLLQLLDLKRKKIKSKYFKKKKSNKRFSSTRIHTKILLSKNYEKTYLTSLLPKSRYKQKRKVWIFKKKIKKNNNKYKKSKFKSKRKRKYYIKRRLIGFLKTKQKIKKKYLLKMRKSNLILKRKLIKKLKKKTRRTKLFLKKTALYLKKFISKEIRFISEPLINFFPENSIKSRFWEKKYLLRKNFGFKKKKVNKSFFKKKNLNKKKKSKKKKSFKPWTPPSWFKKPKNISLLYKKKNRFTIHTKKKI